MSKGRSPSVICICETCQQPFRPWHSKPERQNRFCSRECAPRGRVRTLLDIHCANCGVLFRPLARRTEYCSRDCYLKKTQGRVKNSSGYILIYQPEHPHATKAGQVLEHRVVMEKMIGRYLKPHENVHHKNGDRTDNKPTNLELWIKRQPPGQRIEDLMAWAEQLLKHYKPIAQKLRAYQPDDPRQAKLFEAI